MIQMIRTGRPAFHIKAYWISIDSPEGLQFYKLDHRSRLEKTDNKIVPHHCKQFAEQEIKTTEIKQQQQQQNDITKTPSENNGSIELFDNWLFDDKSMDLIEPEFSIDMYDSLEGELQDNWFQ